MYRIQCGLCGKECEIPSDTPDGQHIRCPHCNGTSVFQRPARIQLPTEPRSAPIGQTASNDAKKSKPDLYVRRPAQTVQVEDPNARRKLNMCEDRVRFYEQMRTAESRRKALQKISSSIVLLALVVVGVFVYLSYEHRKDEAARLQVEHERERQKLQAERELKERKDRAQREIEERERRDRLEAEENARRERREAEEKVVRERQRQEEANKRAQREEYRLALSMLGEGRLDFYNALPKGMALDKTDGIYYYLLPFSEDHTVTVSMISNKVATVYRLTSNGEQFPEDANLFFRKLNEREYLVAFNDSVYFHSKRAKPHVGEITKGKDVDLAEEFFGELMPEIEFAKMEFEDLAFEIVFVPRTNKSSNNKPIITQTVEFGMRYDEKKIREAVEEEFPMQANIPSYRSKKKKGGVKRTVMYWDGVNIKRGLDGVTYVPRVAPSASYRRADWGWGSNRDPRGPGWDRGRIWYNNGKSAARAQQVYDHWSALCKKADEEEAAEREYNESHETRQRDAVKTQMSAAETRYAKQIDDMLENGQLFWRARLKWKQQKR